MQKCDLANRFCYFSN